jgi:hypothetical protein
MQSKNVHPNARRVTSSKPVDRYLWQSEIPQAHSQFTYGPGPVTVGNGAGFTSRGH